MNMYGSETINSTSTLEDFIAMRKNDTVTYYDLSILAKSLTNPDLIYSESNILDTYMDELKKLAVTVELSPEDYSKYKFRPKLLCYDIYGMTEMYFIIMALNGICSIKDFNFKKIKLLYKNDMFEFVNSIVAAEQNYISLNREYVGKLD